jgi:hypothetical protein
MEISLLGLDRRNQDLAPCQTAPELHKFFVEGGHSFPKTITFL